jgi:hypothetical protein
MSLFEKSPTAIDRPSTRFANGRACSSGIQTSTAAVYLWSSRRDAGVRALEKAVAACDTVSQQGWRCPTRKVPGLRNAGPLSAAPREAVIETPNRVTSILGPDKTLGIYKDFGNDGRTVRILTRNEPRKAALTSACVVLSDGTPATDFGTAPTSALHEVEAIIMSEQNQPASFIFWCITYASR